MEPTAFVELLLVSGAAFVEHLLISGVDTQTGVYWLRTQKLRVALRNTAKVTQLDSDLDTFWKFPLNFPLALHRVLPRLCS